MSSHSTSASAAAAANQALIALVTWLTEMVQDVIQLLSQEEKMELSWKIAHEVNDTICTYGKEASYVPPGLLSLAAEIFCTQRHTTQLHPLYSKTLGATPPIVSAASATAPAPAPPPAPIPAPPPASTPAPTPVPPPAPAPPLAPAVIDNTEMLTQYQPSCASWQPVLETYHQVKGKAKAKALEVDSDEDDDMIDVNDLPDVQPQKSTRKAIVC
ncbi:hypothetical protein BDR04DRAFT_1156410 [Suillus decipiens]|nr:hypothetical protein BDR04DRAFT_1156410 [Suillus decipiens]